MLIDSMDDDRTDDIKEIATYIAEYVDGLRDAD